MVVLKDYLPVVTQLVDSGVHNFSPSFSSLAVSQDEILRANALSRGNASAWWHLRLSARHIQLLQCERCYTHYCPGRATSCECRHIVLAAIRIKDRTRKRGL